MHKSPSVEERREQRHLRLAVQGMGCPNCVNRVRNRLLQVYGVLSVDVDLDAGLAAVDFNPGLAGVDDLVRAVADAGGDGRHEYRAYPIG